MKKVQKMNDNIERLNAIRAFEKDWNGYGSEPIPEDIINRCEEIVKLLDMQLELFPTGRETIQFEHEFKDKTYIEFEIFKDKVGVLLVPKRKYEKGIDIDLYITEPKQISFFINEFVITFGCDENG